jgi:hypothetical protein
MAKNRQLAAKASKAKVQARAAIEPMGDKFLARTTYAIRKASCLAAYEAHKSALVMVPDGIIARHW